jgi:hypothetical protein
LAIPIPVMAKNPPPRTVLCYYCRHRFEVGGRAMSVSCPGCNKPVIVEDVIVKNYKPVKSLQTCGMLIIRRGGRVAATEVEAQQGVMCDGALAGNVVSGGPVTLGAKAEWKGDLRAPSLVVKGGARILGGYFDIPRNPLAEYGKTA